MTEKSSPQPAPGGLPPLPPIDNSLSERVLQLARENERLRGLLAATAAAPPAATVCNDYNADGTSARIDTYLPAGTALYTEPRAAIPAPEGGERAVLRHALSALVTARDHISARLEHAQECYRGYPDRWAAEYRDLRDTDAAIAKLRAALAAQPKPPQGEHRPSRVGELLAALASSDSPEMRVRLAHELNDLLKAQAAAPSPAEGALTDEQIDAMLSDIDDIARNVDFYEFGLPIADEPRAAMREAVRAAIASKVQPKGTGTPALYLSSEQVQGVIEGKVGASFLPFRREREGLFTVPVHLATRHDVPAAPMTAQRAVYFMERFRHEEKLLGPNEQAALDFVIAMLEAAQAPAPVAGEQDAFNAWVQREKENARERLPGDDWIDNADEMYPGFQAGVAWARSQAPAVAQQTLADQVKAEELADIRALRERREASQPPVQHLDAKELS